MKKLNFQIEVNRILEILSNDIYDSPYALLRENVQNAYDAILMRKSEDGTSFHPEINITINGRAITIEDNGIGMDEEVFQNNYWKAGSSGKNNEEAKKAGVIGTFGIGAMANFGVANSLAVISKKFDTDITIKTSAVRENLSVTEECVEFEVLNENRAQPGTTVEVMIDEGVSFNEAGAIQYLKPYVRYVQVPIKLNGTVISQEKYSDKLNTAIASIENESTISINHGHINANLRCIIQKNSQVKVHVTDIKLNNMPINGDMVLIQNNGNVYGLRSYFGLAPIPVPSMFGFGGIVNLTSLIPTAGREALSRESISTVTQIVNIVEKTVSEQLSKVDVADNNPQFLNYIVNHSRYDLANNIRVEMKPDSQKLKLQEVDTKIGGKETLYYGGRDQSTINHFANENTNLLHLSQSNPRRRIQVTVIRQKGVQEVPDSPSIQEVVDKKDLSMAEVAFMLRITSVLADDYLLKDAVVNFAKISHGVPSIVKKEGEIVSVYLAQNTVSVQQVLQTYKTAYEIFGGFVKDFVRNYLYQKFSQFVPSSTRSGAETLHKILLKNRELFKYESTDLGDLESLLSDYVSGKMGLPEVLKQSTNVRRKHTHYVGRTQVGNAEEEIPNIGESTAEKENISTDVLQPLPPIDRTDSKTSKKILKTGEKYPHLNNFSMFLSLSDRVYKRQLDFFFEPHTTKVIWGMHRIVFIFTHASNNISLYYDIELKERLHGESTGGKPIPTTTILTEDKIFIPVLPELESFFDITEGTKEFFVRHDLITDFSKEEE